MSTSEACELCGEVRDPARIDGGCVACNPHIQAAASKPEVPVNPGPVPEERLGCLQHGVVGCERCGLLETRHRLAFDPHRQDEETGSWVRDDRGGGIGVAILFAFLVLLMAGCFWLFWTNYPR